MGNAPEEGAREALGIPPSVSPAGASDGVNMVGDTFQDVSYLGAQDPDFRRYQPV